MEITLIFCDRSAFVSTSELRTIEVVGLDTEDSHAVLRFTFREYGKAPFDVEFEDVGSANKAYNRIYAAIERGTGLERVINLRNLK